jgi:hypothetical protein
MDEPSGGCRPNHYWAPWVANQSLLAPGTKRSVFKLCAQGTKGCGISAYPDRSRKPSFSTPNGQKAFHLPLRPYIFGKSLTVHKGDFQCF